MPVCSTREHPSDQGVISRNPHGLSGESEGRLPARRTDRFCIVGPAPERKSTPMRKYRLRRAHYSRISTVVGDFKHERVVRRFSIFKSVLRLPYSP